MKFAALGDRLIDPANEQLFIKPVKLNRKDPRTVRRLTDEDRERINKRILERNGLASGVKAEGEDTADGSEDVKPGMEGADGSTTKKEREVIDLTLVGKGVSGAVPAQAQRHKSGLFKKKIRRVFVSSEEARRLKREEWMPWVLEDDEGNERWIGRLEGGAGESVSAQKSAARSAEADAKGTGMSGWRPEAMQTAEAGGGGSSYVAFVNDPDKEGFQVFPVGRWYRFNQGPKYVTLGTEEAETEVSECMPRCQI
jgi:transcription initiation factor TFIIF subunit alpha